MGVVDQNGYVAVMSENDVNQKPSPETWPDGAGEYWQDRLHLLCKTNRPDLFNERRWVRPQANYKC